MPERPSMPESWVSASLTDICEILDHKRVPVNNRERNRRIAGRLDADLYPYFGATGQVGVIDDFIFEGEHILLGEDGAPFLEPLKNQAYLVQGRFWVNNHAHILRSMISNKYVYHYLNTVDYSSYVTGTTRPTLPAEWAYCRLGLLIDEPKYGTSKKCNYNYVGTGVLRIPNIVDGEINTDDLKGAQFEDDEVSTFALAQGDLLMIRSNGSISIVGKSALVSEAEEEYLYAGYLMRLSSNRCVIIPQYLILALENHFVRMQIEQKAKSTSGVNNINAREVQSLVIPLCSANEQRLVFKQIAKDLSVIDALDREVKDQLSTAEVLRRAILVRAFSGQLLPQDPNDESASVLLDRIKAERQQIMNRAMPRKTGRRKKTKVTA